MSPKFPDSKRLLEVVRKHPVVGYATAAAVVWSLMGSLVEGHTSVDATVSKIGVIVLWMIGVFLLARLLELPGEALRLPLLALLWGVIAILLLALIGRVVEASPASNCRWPDSGGRRCAPLSGTESTGDRGVPPVSLDAASSPPTR
jgi:hypothetical protein